MLHFLEILYLTILSTSAIKKGFRSILGYVRFLKMTIYKTESGYDFVSEDKQSQAKSLVSMQGNFSNHFGNSK